MQRDLYKESESIDDNNKKSLVYNTALARERYNNRITRMDTVEPVIVEPEPEIPQQLDLTIRIYPSDTGWQTSNNGLSPNLYLKYDVEGNYNTRIYYKNKYGDDREYSAEYYRYNEYIIRNPAFSPGTSAESMVYNVTIETIDDNGNVYKGTVDFIARYTWIFSIRNLEYRNTLQFDNSILENISKKTVTLNLEE